MGGKFTNNSVFSVNRLVLSLLPTEKVALLVTTSVWSFSFNRLVSLLKSKNRCRQSKAPLYSSLRRTRGYFFQLMRVLNNLLQVYPSLLFAQDGLAVNFVSRAVGNVSR